MKNRSGGNERKKRILLLAIFAMLLASICAALYIVKDRFLGSSTAQTAPLPTESFGEPPTAEPAQTPFYSASERSDNDFERPKLPRRRIASLELAPQGFMGMVAAGKDVSYGVSSCGLLSYIGKTNGRAACYDWRGVVFASASESLTVALTNEGKVLACGDDAAASAVEEWNGAVSVCCTDTDAFALLSDGAVLSTRGELELSGIRFISAGGNNFAAADGNGYIYTAGGLDASALQGKAIASLSVSATHAAAVSDVDTLISTRSGDPLLGESCTSAFAGNGCTALIDKYGFLRTDCEHVLSAVQSGALSGTISRSEGQALAVVPSSAWFCCTSTHALVMHSDGTVTGCGENEYLQCETSSWRLRPYALGEHVLGIAPESGVKTGDTYSELGVFGTAVILGDIDMDGAISEADLALLKKYIAGEAELSEVQMQAANLLRDAGIPDSVDRADLEQLSYHLKGYTVIDQYAKSFAYSAEIGDAERTNGDVCGYIRLKNTNIDAPIMYGKDFYYHYHSWTGASSGNGSIYLYYDYPSKNTVISGHNLRKRGTMLNNLHKLQNNDAKHYGAFKNRVWSINLFGQTRLYEVFSMYEEKPSSPSGSSQYYNCTYDHTMESMSDELIREWIEYQLERTELSYTVPVDTSDRFITVLTCADQHWESNLGGRIYFFLRMVDGH